MDMKKKIFTMLILCVCTLGVSAQSLVPAGQNVKDLQKIHPWTKARVGYLGDSLTDPNAKNCNKKYWGFLEDYLGITPYVYGISGREWDDIPRQATQLKKEHGNDVDAILILCGTNDYNRGIPIGQWYTETAEKVRAAAGDELPNQLYYRMHRHYSRDVHTFCGRLNIALDSLKTLFPDKQIVLLTTPHRAYFGPNPGNIQPDESYTNRIGVYLDAYNHAIEEAGKIWGVPVIDISTLSGINPMNVAQQRYLRNNVDHLHPSDAGHDRIARTLVYQLLGLPCRF